MHYAYMGQEFAKRLKEARELRGLSPKEVAERRRIAYSTYKNHENGRGGERDALKYAELFRVNYLWMARGVGRPTDKPIQQKFDALPTEKQQQVLDYMDYVEKSGRKA